MDPTPGDPTTAASAATASKELTTATKITTTTSTNTTTIAGYEAQSATGSGCASGLESASEPARCPTGGQEQQQQLNERYNNNAFVPESQQKYQKNNCEPESDQDYHNNRFETNGEQQYNKKRYNQDEQQQNNNNRYGADDEQHNNNNRYGPTNGNWHQFQSHNSGGRPNGRRTRFKNNINWQYNPNNSKKTSRGSYHNQNNSNWQQRKNWKNSDSFNSYNCGDFRRNNSYKPVKWSTRDNQEGTDYYRSSRSREKSYEGRREDATHYYRNSRSRDKSCEGKRESGWDRRARRSQSRDSREKKEERCIENGKEIKEEREDKKNINENCEESLIREGSNNEQNIVFAPIENAKAVPKDTSITVKRTLQLEQNSSYPQIQVRPLNELLKQEIIALTQEEFKETAAPSGTTTGDTIPSLPSPLPGTQTRRHTVGSAGNNNGIAESLANMDKESLKYIINNSDTIYNEHLKTQARRRLRDEIRRQLKKIELEQPKDKAPKDLVEDEIVEAIKLPQVLLKEIEKCFGFDISVPKTKEEITVKTNSTDPREKSVNVERKNESLDQFLVPNQTKELSGNPMDLMTRIQVAEKFKALSSKRSTSSQGSNRKPERNEQKSKLQIKVDDRQTQVSPQRKLMEAEIKKEFQTTNRVDCIVLSSSEDEEQISEQEVNNSTNKLYLEKLKLDADQIIANFEEHILPHLKGSLADRYRSNHSASVNSRLHFISCIVTSSEHNSHTFSREQVAKIQKILKEPNNRKALDFLSGEIDNVMKEKQKLPPPIEPNELNASSSKSAETASVEHQRNCSPERVALPPTPPRNDTPTNVAQSMRSLHANSGPLNLGSLLGLDATLPRFSPSESSVGDSVMQSLLEIDRRLLENQNRRSFLDEMIMKFQKEKSDLEMISLEFQSRKFLLLNSLISRTTAVNSAPTSTVTPTNSPPPGPTIPSAVENATSAPAGVTTRSKRNKKRRVIVKRVKILPKRKLSKPMQSTEAPTVPEVESTQGALMIKDEPMEETISNSSPSASPKRQRLTRSATLIAAQQPLAVIPPLNPPPPPPSPIVELPRILRKSTTASAPAEVPRTPNTSVDYGYIPIGRLHNITSPITQIRIFKVHIIAASENGEVYVFNIANHKLERQVIKHSEAITNMFLCEKESCLYTTSLDGFLKKTSLENLERVMQTVYLKEPLQSIDIAWGLAFIGSRWGNIFIYNIAANKLMEMPLLSTGQSVIAVKATKEGPRKIIMLGCKGNYVFLHDASSGLLLRRLSIPEGLNVYSLLLIDGHVFCGTQKNEVYKFEFSSGNMCNTLSCGNGAVAMVTYKERYLLIGCYDGFIYVLNKETGMRLGRFNGPGRLVLALAIAGDKVVASSKDNSLEILEIPSELLNLEDSG